MNFCTKCSSLYTQPGTCNCYAGARGSPPPPVVIPPTYVGDPPYTPAPTTGVYPLTVGEGVHPLTVGPRVTWQPPYPLGGGSTIGVKIGEGGTLWYGATQLQTSFTS